MTVRVNVGVQGHTAVALFFVLVLSLIGLFVSERGPGDASDQYRHRQPISRQVIDNATSTLARGEGVPEPEAVVAPLFGDTVTCSS